MSSAARPLGCRSLTARKQLPSCVTTTLAFLTKPQSREMSRMMRQSIPSFMVSLQGGIACGGWCATKSKSDAGG